MGGEVVVRKWQDTLAELRHTFLTRDGWVGDYVSTILVNTICAFQDHSY